MDSSQGPAKENISQCWLMSDIQFGYFTCPLVVFEELTYFATLAYVICAINSY